MQMAKVARDKSDEMCARVRRACSGQAIVEGVSMLTLMVAVGIGILMLLVNVGIFIDYKQKLHEAAYSAAIQSTKDLFFLSCKRPSSQKGNIAATARRVAEAALMAVNLPAPQSVDTDVVTVNGTDCVRVTINISRAKLLNSGGILPSFIALKETAVVPVTLDAPISWASLHFNDLSGRYPNDMAIQVPCVRAYIDTGKDGGSDNIGISGTSKAEGYRKRDHYQIRGLNATYFYRDKN